MFIKTFFPALVFAITSSIFSFFSPKSFLSLCKAAHYFYLCVKMIILAYEKVAQHPT